MPNIVRVERYSTDKTDIRDGFPRQPELIETYYMPIDLRYLEGLSGIELQPIDGKMNILRFDTRDEALSYCTEHQDEYAKAFHDGTDYWWMPSEKVKMAQAEIRGLGKKAGIVYKEDGREQI